ncbi:MAG: phenylalanine--tRNA ligase subunit beta [Treponema sp.]|jgi:phenylalanyl-tRNA synthetase beta chain|nr:phenylalanine--tRNA ligase subunit beta [Treponema sp.]
MPKIEVNEETFYALSGRRWTSKEELEEALVAAKAELDGGFGEESTIPEERIIKIELNDTNRPDLWGTAGCARQLRLYYADQRSDRKASGYSFFSTPKEMKSTKHKVIIEKSVAKVRPFMVGFVATGKEITDPMLRDMIQTQEKLAWNFGRRRRSISMGLYRTSIIKWPIIYKGADPDSVSFVPLQWEESLTLREILKQHPKGKEYAFILEHENIHPLLTDSTGAVLSYPPIINSADLGAVQVGDSEIFVELTGTDQKAVTLAASIMACDLSDNGFTIEPAEMEYEYDTPLGKKCVTPFYFQEPVFCSLWRIEKFLGEKLSADDCVAALAKMGVKASKDFDVEKAYDAKVEGIRAWPPEYRNDFLHAADVAEDVMIGRGLDSFKPEHPRDFTVGRLTPVTLFSRKVKELMTGMGYQEMIYNYLGSRKDLVEKMRGDGKSIIRISNPMTENYEYVRDSIIASLLTSEAVSGHSVYPHKFFEIGKITYWDNDSSITRQYLGFLHADRDANFNTAAAQIQTLFYYISREYEVQESADPRFISGRAALILYKGKSIGVFGEVHPQVLENWGVTFPCTAGEMDIEDLL